MEPTLLLLDEPTNHLDLNAVIWLDKYGCDKCVGAVIQKGSHYFYQDVILKSSFACTKHTHEKLTKSYNVTSSLDTTVCE